jgi:WD40 repeat protein
MGSCKGHSSFVTHVGWSADSTRLFSNSGDYELLFWEMPSGKRVTDSGSCRDVAWAGYSGVLGACARHPRCSFRASRAGRAVSRVAADAEQGC